MASAPRKSFRNLVGQEEAKPSPIVDGVVDTGPAVVSRTRSEKRRRCASLRDQTRSWGMATVIMVGVVVVTGLPSLGFSLLGGEDGGSCWGCGWATGILRGDDFHTAGRLQPGGPPRPISHTDEGLAVVVARRVPERAAPETEAIALLELLEHLPAQPPVVARLSSPYGWRVDPLDSGRRRPQFHRGIDFDVPTGTPVRAPAPGMVVSVHQGMGYGRYLKIRHDRSGYLTILAHLSAVTVSVGDAVRRGDVVAFSGGGGREEGRSTGPHLHFEIRRLKPGSSTRDAVDPARIYAAYWDAWDAVQTFPRARVHAQYPPYALSMVRFDRQKWRCVRGGLVRR